MGGDPKLYTIRGASFQDDKKASFQVQRLLFYIVKTNG